METAFFQTNAQDVKRNFRVIFAVEQIVLLDGYPRRDYGAVQFRFVVVLPHNVPLIQLRQPLLSNRILSSGIFIICTKILATNKTALE